jgi:hypothetical protein
MPPAVLYVAAVATVVITTVAAVAAFNQVSLSESGQYRQLCADSASPQFVYEPHIAPRFEAWQEEVVNGRENRRRRRRQQSEDVYDLDSNTDGGMGESMSSSVRDFTRHRDDHAERSRRAAAAADWRRLTDSVSELDSQRGQSQEMQEITRTGVDDPVSSAGLRRRTAGPMDQACYTSVSPSYVC